MHQQNPNQSFMFNRPLKFVTIALFSIVMAISAACATPVMVLPGESGGGGDSPRQDEERQVQNKNYSESAADRAEESAPSMEDERASAPLPTASPYGGGESSVARESAADSDLGSYVSRPEPPKKSDRYEPVTAGVVDDNEAWEDYLEYRSRRGYRTRVNDRDVSERYMIFVQNESGFPVHDALVSVSVDDTELFAGRTDSGGRVLFHPAALDSAVRWHWRRSDEFQVTAQKEWVAQRQSFTRYENEVWTLTLVDPPSSEVSQVDLLFLMDATGSMDDEIAKLKASMADIADQIYNLPNDPDVRFGLVHYRDRGDAYVVRTHDFTRELFDFQDTLSDLRAGGGGDYPESLNEALHRSLNELSWRTQERDGDTLRLILLVADAPPHLDYTWQSYSYDTDMIAAAELGIKIFPIGASGLEEQGEYIFRQMAQFTGGKFVFLTYEDGSDPSSGPGTETDHDVENYSVNTLDRLVVRLVKDELEKLSEPVAIPEQMVDRSAYPAPRTNPTPRPISRLQPVSCTLDLDSAWNDCGGIAAIDYVDMHPASRDSSDGQAVMKLTLDPRHSGYMRAQFAISFDEAPAGWTVNIGDSPSNNGYGGDAGDQSNDAEMILIHGAVAVYGNDYIPERATTDGHREIYYAEDMIRDGETMVIEVANNWLALESPGGKEAFDSPYLFALARQPDREGRPNSELFASFNRTIASGARNGSGASQVIITLYPR